MKKVIGSRQNEILLLLSAGGLLLFFWGMSFFFSLQGKFFVYQEAIPPDPNTGFVDYRYLVKVVDGFQTKKFEFARYRGDDSVPFTFMPHDQLWGRVVLHNPSTKQKTFAIWGENTLSHPVLALIHYENGEFSLIPHYNGSQNKQIAFSSTRVILENLDEDPELEVVEKFLSGCEDTPWSWFIMRFDFNEEENAYFRTELKLEPYLYDGLQVEAWEKPACTR